MADKDLFPGVITGGLQQIEKRQCKTAVWLSMAGNVTHASTNASIVWQQASNLHAYTQTYISARMHALVSLFACWSVSTYVSFRDLQDYRQHSCRPGATEVRTPLTLAQAFVERPSLLDVRNCKRERNHAQW